MELKNNIKVFINKDYISSTDLFNKIAAEESIKECINQDFVLEIEKREKKFPTGIIGPVVNFAIPHTDPVNIREPFIAIIKPNNPVNFHSMGIEDVEVAAEIIILLGVVNNGDQIEMLQRLMELFMDETKINKLMSENNEEKIRSIFKEYVFPDYVGSSNK